MKGTVRNRGGVKQANGSYRGGTWTAYWWDDTIKDKRTQRSKGGFATKAEAKQHLEAILTAKRDRTYVAPARTTLGAYLTETWLPLQRQRLRPSTLHDYDNRINTHVVPYLGNIQLQDLDAQHLDRLYSQLLERGGPKGKPLAPKTVRNVHVVLRKALADASRKRLVARNVAIDADPPRVPSAGERDHDVWSPDELRAFLVAIKDHPLAPAYVLAASTGMRRGEVLGLRWDDVDLDLRTIAIRQTVISVNYEVLRSEPKTARGRRTISIDEATAAILRYHHAVAKRAGGIHEHPLFGRLVFARPDGSPIHPDFFSQTFDRTVAKQKLRKVRLHDLRHSYATLALRAGVDAKTVSSRLGHSTVAFTLDVYTKAVPQLDQAAAAQVAALIFRDA